MKRKPGMAQATMQYRGPENTLWTSLLDVAKSRESGVEKFLRFDQKSGQFSCSSASFFDRFKMTIGLSDMSGKHVAKGVRSFQNVLTEQSSKASQDDVRKVQNILNKISLAARENTPFIDLFKGKHESWMANLPEEIKNKKFNELLLPATHDSGAHKVDFSNPISTKSRALTAANIVCKIFPFIRKIISDWTVTQNYSIREQLEKGIRSFDFRISHNADDNKFYISHTFNCIPVETALNEIEEFMRNHPGEAIIIHTKPDHPHRESMDKAHADQFMSLLQAKLNDLLCPPNDQGTFDESKTLKKMVDSGKRILVTYDDQQLSREKFTFLWSAYWLTGTWDDTSDVNEMKRSLDQKITQYTKDDKRMNAISFNLTTQVDDIKKYLISSLTPGQKQHTLRGLSDSIRRYMPTYFENHKNELDKISQVVVDFATSDFVDLVVQENLKHSGRR